jgi:hypothetical protein
MGIFNIFNRSTPEPTKQTSSNGLSLSMFSTPFLNIGDGNLALPYVNNNFQQNGIIRFGQDNLYPQILNQLYLTSAIHNACIDFLALTTIGGSYEWENNVITAKEKVDLITFERMNKFKKMARDITKDFVIHRRICVLITKQSGKLIKLTRLDPSSIRNFPNNEKFEYSSDWSRGAINLKTYLKYTPECKDGTYLYVYQESTPGQDTYPIPGYNSILNWAFLDGEQSFFHKSNIQNSVFPSLAIRRPKEFSSKDEIQQFKEEISSTTGTQNAGRVMVLTGNGIENVPDLIQISGNTNDKLFIETAKELKDNICFAHKINPSIMGIKVAGSLGNSEELKISYMIYEKNTIMPLREIMEEIFNDLISICGISNYVTINNFQIIENEISETQLNQQKEKNETDNSNASLETVEQSVVNDALKGLSAAENSDIYRIVRDFTKGKMPEFLAVTRLRAYGLTDVEARSILGL